MSEINKTPLWFKHLLRKITLYIRPVLKLSCTMSQVEQKHLYKRPSSFLMSVLTPGLQQSFSVVTFYSIVLLHVEARVCLCGA